MQRKRILAALFCLAFLLPASSSAQVGTETSGYLFSDSLSFGGDPEDLLALVQYTDAMMDCALVFASRRDKHCRFMQQANEVRFSFWVWRDDTGTIINRTLRGGYRWRPPGCLEGFCLSMECRIPSAPSLLCDDGTEHIWSAPDRVHFEIDDVVFERIRNE